MAQLIIDVSPRGLDALSFRFRYQVTMKSQDGKTDVQNPETQEAFVTRQITALLRDICVASEVQQAEQAARKQAMTSAQAAFSLTKP